MKKRLSPIAAGKQRHFPFTNERLSAAPTPASGFYYLYDNECPSLCVRVFSGGSRTYQVKYRHDGSQKYIPLRALEDTTSVGLRVGDVTVAKARELAKIITGGLHTDLATTGTTPKQRKRASMTLREALIAYTTMRVAKGKMKLVTADLMLRELPRCVAPFIDKPIGGLNYETLASAHNRILGNNGPAVARRVMTYIGTLIRYVELTSETRLFEINPASKVIKYDAVKLKPRKTCLLPDYFPPFFDAVDTMPPDTRDFIYLLLFTGVRVDSVKTLRWDFLDFRLGIIALTTAKGEDTAEYAVDADVRTPMSRHIRALLLARKERLGVTTPEAEKERPWVFPAECDSSRHMGEHKKMITELAKLGDGNWDNAKGGALSFHDLRRTFISVATGVEVDAVAAHALSLHKTSTSATGVHMNYINPLHLRKPLEKITAEILCLAGSPELGRPTLVSSTMAAA